MRIIDWDEFITTGGESDAGGLTGLAVTIGVFDGVHRGHQALLGKICGGGRRSTVVTFRQNPLRILRPGDFSGDIYRLERKLELLSDYGVAQAVLIDFSAQFSIITGRAFIDLLLHGRRVELLALGRNFRCGHGLDWGVAEIAARAAESGVETWVAEPVMEGGRRISSSRIRQAIAAGRLDEAALLLGRPYSVPK
jgi:riboflavin kinase/FMN adenylyltransferase